MMRHCPAQTFLNLIRLSNKKEGFEIVLIVWMKNAALLHVHWYYLWWFLSSLGGLKYDGRMDGLLIELEIE